MTNEEAFRKWRTDYESDYDKKPSYLEVWQAAIAYMQGRNESVSEPVAWLEMYKGEPNNLAFCSVNLRAYPEEFYSIKPLYTTPQRQQPLKRLSDAQRLKIFKEFGVVLSNANYELLNAIMDEMERLNKL